MRKLVVILSILNLIAGGCGQVTNKRTGVTINETVSEQRENDSTVQVKYNNNPVENAGKDFRQIGLDEKIGNRTLRDYLSDEKIPKVFKDVFLQKQSLFEEEEKTLTLIDSLFSTDKERHPFYFALVTRATWWSDGAFSEPLGMAVKEYVEFNTQQFLEYFSTETILTLFDFKKWAEYTLGEILIEYEDNFKMEIENTRALMKKNCNGCSLEKIKMINKFIEYMYAEHDEIQRRNKEWEINHYNDKKRIDFERWLLR